MSDPILVTGTLDFDPEKRDEVIAAMVPMMATTRAEDGNTSYTFSADLEELGRFHISEQWASQEAIDSHNSSSHMADFMGQMGSLGAQGASITMWTGATATKVM